MPSHSPSPPPAGQPVRQSGRARQLTERARAAIESATAKLTGKRSRRRRGSDSSASADSGASNASAPDDESSNSGTESVTATQPDTAAAGKKPLTKKEAFEIRFKTLSRPNEKVLAKQMALWKSSYYDHFKSPPNIVEEDGEVKYQFVCRQHTSNVVTHVRHDDGTSNLKRHVNRCEGRVNTAEAAAMTVYASGCHYKEGRHCARLVLWITRRRRPFAIVADLKLLEIFTDLHA